MRYNLATPHTVFRTALLLLFLAGCGSGDKRPESNEPPKPKVSVATPQVTTGKSLYSYPGEIRASRETELSFRVGGPLTAILKKPGDKVRKGEILMQLDRRDYLDNIRVLKAELAGARAREKKSAADFKRAKELFRQDVIAQADYDLARSASLSADATVQNILAQLALARHRLEDASLRAPYDGTVTAQLVENHEMIPAGRPVMRMNDISSLEIDSNVPENDIGRFMLSKGMKAKLRLPSLGNRFFEAELREWSTEADKATRTYKLTFALPAPEEGGILPGMTAEVVVSELTPAEPVTTVPLSVLAADREGNSIVWLYDEATQTVEPGTIETGAMYDDENITVTGGLEGNELVVTEGMHSLASGMKVEALKTPAAATARQQKTPQHTSKKKP